MKIALVSDIHGNSLALDAVLADIVQQAEVDLHLFLGDYVAIGADPIGVLQRLQTVPNALFIRGNADRYVVTGERPGPTLAEVESDTTLLAHFKQMNEGLAWAQGMATAVNGFDWLAELPLEEQLTLPDGTRLLAVHASPGRDESWGLSPNSTDAQLRKLFSDCDADLISVGHTHHVTDRTVDGRHLLNPGSVSNPSTVDKRATYMLLAADEDGYKVSVHYVAYDWQHYLQQAKDVHFPGESFLRWIYTRHDEKS